jgi:hypothetical protein
MYRQTSFGVRMGGAVVAVAVAVVAVSCGGDAERASVVGPAPAGTARPTTPDGGGLSEAAQPAKTTVCHCDTLTGICGDLAVPLDAVSPHLKHGDKLGSCNQGPACPCFTSQQRQQLENATCPSGQTLTQQCFVSPTYSRLEFDCSTTSPQALVGQTVVSGSTCQFVTPDNTLTINGLTPEQVAACHSAIASYPGITCATDP